MKKYKKTGKIFWGFVVILVSGCLTAGLSACNSEKEEPLAYVGEIPIYGQELGFAAQNCRLTIRNHVMVDHDLESDDFSWQKDYGDGQTPLEQLQEKVLEECAYEKLLQEECRKQGLLDKIDYPSLNKKREDENKEREERKAKNQVIYGIMNFDEKEYYDYMNSNLELRLTEILSQKGMIEHSDEELRSLYEENLDYFQGEAYEDVKTSVVSMANTQAFELYMDEQLENAKVTYEGEEVSEFLLEAVS